MNERISFEDLRAILVAAAGAAGAGELGQNIIDTDLYDMGYDSLALLEVAARVKERYAVAIPDDEVTDLRTFRLILDRVNKVLDVSDGR